jgi:hypothetical protein
MDISWAFTGDGLLAFAGGALALLGVWWSNHQSVKNLRKQFEAERNARAEGTESQKRAVATAIAFEVDFIYRGFVRDVEAVLRKARTFGDIIGKRIEEFPFTIYEGCAALLGGLPPPLVEGIVNFYGGISLHLMTLNEIYSAVQHAQNASLGDDRLKEVKMLVEQTLDGSHHVRRLATEVSERLCEFAGIPKSRMAVLTDTQESHAQTH